MKRNKSIYTYILLIVMVVILINLLGECIEMKQFRQEQIVFFIK